MSRMLKTFSAALAALCCLTIAASCFLALSYVTLKGLDNPRPLGVLALFVAESGLTLAALALYASVAGLDLLVSAGAAGLMWLGWSIASTTLSGPHFEGYALVMGAAGVLQGALTLARFLLFTPRHIPGL